MPALRPLPDDARCPCLSGDTYGACCGRFHGTLVTSTGGGTDGTEHPAAPTAEALMRSRYSAFVVADTDYLRATWHPSTRPASLDLDPRVEWRRLDVVRTVAGGPFDATGTVEFVAHHRTPGPGGAHERGRLHEVSRFVREDGRWSYLDGDVTDRAD